MYWRYLTDDRKCGLLSLHHPEKQPVTFARLVNAVRDNSTFFFTQIHEKLSSRSMGSRAKTLSLYKQLIKESKKFPSYNYRWLDIVMFSTINMKKNILVLTSFDWSHFYVMNTNVHDWILTSRDSSLRRRQNKKNLGDESQKG